VGYDAAKKVKGRKRHAVVDTLGLMLGCAVLPGKRVPSRRWLECEGGVISGLFRKP
jgi:hypothetical protein